MRLDEHIKIVPKGWGEERWIHNDELYCGKILVLKQGKHCSLHYHKLKTETFYVSKGELSMEMTDLEGLPKHHLKSRKFLPSGKGMRSCLSRGWCTGLRGLPKKPISSSSRHSISTRTATA